MDHESPQCTTEWVDVGEHRLFLRRWAAPEKAVATVVLVHGIVSGRYLRPTADSLARRCGVLVPDLPGFGRSSRPRRTLSIEEEAEVLATLMVSLGIGSATVLGHSIGAQIAASLASRHPGAVQRLVLAGPTGDPQAPSAMAVIRRWFANSPAEPVSFNALACRELIDVGVRRMLATLQAALADPFLDNVRNTAAPAVVVRGELDRVAPQEWAERIRSELGNGRLVTLPGFAHTLVYTAPRELAQVLLESPEPAEADGPSRSS